MTMTGADVVNELTMDIYRLKSMLKAFREAAYEFSFNPNEEARLKPHDFPYLFETAIDRLSIIENHTEEIEAKINKLLEAGVSPTVIEAGKIPAKRNGDDHEKG